VKQVYISKGGRREASTQGDRCTSQRSHSIPRALTDELEGSLGEGVEQVACRSGVARGPGLLGVGLALQPQRHRPGKFHLGCLHLPPGVSAFWQ